jgi:hypothetical protein
VAGEFQAQADQIVQDGGVHVAGHDGGDGGVAGEGVGGVAVEPGGAVAAGDRGGGAGGGPAGPDPFGPGLLQFGAGVQGQQVGQGDVRDDLGGLPGPGRDQAGGDQPVHRLGEGVVVALGVGPVMVGAAGRGQCLQHGADERRAFGCQVARHYPGAVEGGLQPQGTVVQQLAGIVVVGGIGAGLGLHLGGQFRQVPQAQAAPGGSGQDRVGVIAAVLGELVGPLAQGPGVGLRQVPGGQCLQQPGVGVGPPGPGQVPGGGTAGDPGLVDQPGPRAVSL